MWLTSGGSASPEAQRLRGMADPEYKAQQWMEPTRAAEGAMGSLIKPEERAKEMGFTLLPEKEAYAEMSKRLLSGWTMLNEHCPISGFPLLRKDGVTWSVRCNMEVKTAKDAPKATLAPRPAPPATAPAAAPTPLAERLRQRAAPEFDEDEVDLRMPKPEPEPTASASVGPNGAVISSDDITAQLSDLLLKGWRMLEDECPVTGACPLMLQKSTGRKFSVAIQKFVDELEAPAVEPPVASSATAAEVPAHAPTVQERQEDNDSIDAELDDDDDDFITQYREQRLAEMQAASTQSNPPQDLPAVGSTAADNSASTTIGEDVASVLERASASLVRQIAAAEARLNGTSGSVSVTDAIALAQLIGASATALRQLQPTGGPVL